MVECPSLWRFGICATQFIHSAKGVFLKCLSLPSRRSQDGTACLPRPPTGTWAHPSLSLFLPPPHRILGEAAGMGPTPSTSGSYQGEPSPRSQQRGVLGPVPLTRIARADALLDQEDEIFKL